MRELDAAIAGALGYEVSYAKGYKGRVLYDNKNMPGIVKGDFNDVCPLYSTDGNAMLELDREMRKRGWLVVMSIKENDCTANYYKPIGDDPYNTEKMFISKADTEPLARALAAYHALTGKEWKNE